MSRRRGEIAHTAEDFVDDGVVGKLLAVVAGERVDATPIGRQACSDSFRAAAAQ
jgi:hypothetical protein